MGCKPIKQTGEECTMTQQELQELCIVDAYTARIYTYTTAEKAEADVAAAKACAVEHLPFWENFAATSGNPHDAETAEDYRRADYRIMTVGDFLKFQREKILGETLEEITAERYHEMLDVLPPLAWTQHKGVEMFCMSEFETGNYTRQFARDHATGKYYTKLVDYRDRSTWICEILYPKV